VAGWAGGRAVGAGNAAAEEAAEAAEAAVRVGFPGWVRTAGPRASFPPATPQGRDAGPAAAGCGGESDAGSSGSEVAATAVRRGGTPREVIRRTGQVWPHAADHAAGG
jgi:hypothetical protein